MYNTKKVSKTRKSHLCEMCHRQILIGSSAISVAGISEDNDFFHGYMCITCDQITHTDTRDPWYFGDVVEYLEKGETPEGLLTKLKEEQWQRTLAQIGTLATQISSNMTTGHSKT